MEPYAKLQVISMLKNFKYHKYLHPGLKVDQIYPYNATSPDLLVTWHCCGNAVIEIKCRESVCESVLSEKNLDCLIKDVYNLIRLKKNHSYYAHIQGQMAIAKCTDCWCFIYTFNGYHLEKIFFDEIYWCSTLIFA